MERILVLAPYKYEILKALQDCKLDLNKDVLITLIGNKKLIYETLVANNINFHFDIIDIEGEIEICLYAKSMIMKHKINMIIFGSIPKAFYYKVMDVKSKIYQTINLNIVKHRNKLAYVVSNDNETLNSFDRLNGIRIIKDFIYEHNSKHICGCMVYPKVNENLLEAKLNVMILEELKLDSLEIISTKELISDSEKYNLIIFNSNDTMYSYLDFLSIISKPKISEIVIFNYNELYAVDAQTYDSYQNLKFSFNIVNSIANKLNKQKKIS